MKRINHLFDKIIAFENLHSAALKAQKGKKNKFSTAVFFVRLEEHLFDLQNELSKQTYQPGAYHTFYIHDPKKRMISAAPFRDRVVHHALCNVIEPIFEKTFIFDCYANRLGKGTHKALNRYQYFAKKYKYVLKSDIRKFFPSIDHKVLKALLRRKVKCKNTLWLIDKIIDNSNSQESIEHLFPGDDLFTSLNRRKGLPIGNLTSQFWANVYMNGFDHFVKERLRAKGYIRYVDDFVVFSSSKSELNDFRKEIQNYLINLRLKVHPNKTQIKRTIDGIPFLGFTIFPNRKYVKKEKIKRFRRHLDKQMSLRTAGLLLPQQLEDGLNAWLGHIRFGNSEIIERRVFNYLRKQGVQLFKHPNGSWRVLEQQ